ncbi:NAD(P)H-dependent FMN reductase [Nitrosomonas sp. PY1]|uniref:NADPH-dependent FMN reductase n=1 Tax=Nitrosomonas sp. PY1 TaxID=1803906 RepID=UPI001FC85E78|nr:NADPH-dependent FMN reductase [Nitrosomonas sp. PY1]GKS68920.1 NAD(P)H-dependent FMN reductase [Nitrosomonas sp. PY1]
MIRIIGITGSLRSGSLNTALLRAAANLMPSDSTLEIATLKGIPLYDGDIEANEGIPKAVLVLQEQIAAADGLLLATPEYNNSMPGVFKNATDWLSRPPSGTARIFGDRPVALMGASPGGFGTVLSQNAWLPVLRTLGMRPWFGGRLLVSRAHHIFNESGEMVDEAARKQLQDFLIGFIEFIQAGSKLRR